MTDKPDNGDAAMRREIEEHQRDETERSDRLFARWRRLRRNLRDLTDPES